MCRSRSRAPADWNVRRATIQPRTALLAEAIADADGARAVRADLRRSGRRRRRAARRAAGRGPVQPRAAMLAERVSVRDGAGTARAGGERAHAPPSARTAVICPAESAPPPRRRRAARHLPHGRDRSSPSLMTIASDRARIYSTPQYGARSGLGGDRFAPATNFNRRWPMPALTAVARSAPVRSSAPPAAATLGRRGALGPRAPSPASGVARPG